MYLDSMELDDDELAEMAGGITKDEVRDEIHFILEEADLNQVTKREVKEHLYTQFGDGIDVYNDYINHCIEEFTLEKLALI